jgi:hypothetical protein
MTNSEQHSFLRIVEQTKGRLANLLDLSHEEMTEYIRKLRKTRAAAAKRYYHRHEDKKKRKQDYQREYQRRTYVKRPPRAKKAPQAKPTEAVPAVQEELLVGTPDAVSRRSVLFL